MEQIGPYEIKALPSDAIGKGSFGNVYRGKHKDTGDPVAAKCIMPQRNFDAARIKAEVATIKAVQGHPNILGILDDFDKNSVHWIITELCPLGNLNEYAKKFRLSVGHTLHIMEQMASALAFLHGLDPPVVHRDMKPDNVLFKLEGVLHLLKICDFGVSKELKDITESSIATVTGTKAYKSPELFKDGKTYSNISAADVFAAGLILHQLIEVQPGKGLPDDVIERLIGETMFKNNQSYTVEIFPNDSALMVKIKELINNMISRSPEKRKTMAEVEAEIKKLISNPGAPPSVPEMITKKPLCRKIAHHKLDVAVSDHVGFSDDYVLAENELDQKLIKFAVTNESDSIAYEKEWQKDRPVKVKNATLKNILTDGRIVLTNSIADSETYIFSEDLEDEEDLLGEYGSLVGLLPGDNLLYVKLQGTNSKHRVFQLDVRSMNNQYRIKTLPIKTKSAFLSVCVHPDTHWFAIADHFSQTLDIYDDSYQVQAQEKLGFCPLAMNAVASCKDYIVVCDAESAALDVYDWGGSWIQSFEAEDLKLESSDAIVGIGSVADGKIQLVVRDNQNVCFLMTYDLE